jgi:hypothetical protein
MSQSGPRLTPKRLAALRQAAGHSKGSIPVVAGLTARDEEALEQLGYAASIDDCGHVNADPDATLRAGHGSHPHFFRITPAGRAAVQAAGPGDSSEEASPAATAGRTPGTRPGWPARVSHYTSPEQLAALEAVRTQAKAGGRAVPVAALLRAAAAICLDDPQLRARMIELARDQWR